MTPFEWFALVVIFLTAMAGGWLPFFGRRDRIIAAGLPLGSAFAAGVFLALSMVVMLPGGFHLFGKAYPSQHFPLAPTVAVSAYVVMLGLGHLAHSRMETESGEESPHSPLIPVIMTIMIAIPSFLLGTALGVSATWKAVVIFLAIIAHKGSAAFALALTMVRSTLTRPRAFALFGVFACATPLGIFGGADVHQYLSGHAVLVGKGVILSAAAGVFLYMATLHEMKHPPLVVDCCTPSGFIAMLGGLSITILVRLAFALAQVAHHG